MIYKWWIPIREFGLLVAKEPAIGMIVLFFEICTFFKLTKIIMEGMVFVKYIEQKAKNG
ncbi:MAG: hypothetical protein F6K54_23175 [Okeania sp. SIO3B5]|uniref:hypothetical protein n=1 Tax=Okeania sp. SIO3B5 TaxID=2607811 RepID=UPI0013FEB43D|nr:hypothetical protein [Okeania sp. SIO3B5]NEO55711.1 hypothetical protein [Okeania sp. SIO3B5]